MLKGHFVMFLGSIENFTYTGTLFSSSKWAARALSDPMKSIAGPRRILEVGAGTGAVTTEIIRRMNPEDNLIVVEMNPKFMATLKESIVKLPEFTKHSSRIEFFEGPVQDLPENHKHELIVCALPFLNFELSLVKEIFEKFNRLGTTNAVMTHFEYMGLRKIGCAISQERKKRLFELTRFLETVGHKNLISKKSVWLNPFPINIYTVKLPFNTELYIPAAD